jgi:hypothetical protein
MPEIREIDEFKNEFIRLGNEPEIRSQRGEPLPNITVPESGDTDDLSALFDEPVDDGGTPDDLLEGLFGEEFPADDDEQASEDLFSDAGEDAAELPPDAAGDEGPDVLDDFGDLDSLDFAEETVDDEFTEESPVEESPVEDGFDELPAVENIAEESSETVEFEEEFSIPEGLTDGFAEDLEPQDTEPQDTEPDFAFDEDAFDLEDALPEVSEPEDASEVPAADGFDEIADFDSLDMSDDSDSFDVGSLPDDGFEFEPGDSSSETDLPSESSDDFSFDDVDKAGGEDEFSDNMSDDDFSLEDFSLGEIDDGDIEATEFSLGDLGQEFGVDDGAETDIGSLEELSLSTDESGMELADAFDDDSYAIPDDEYIELKKTLGQMPRNLKILIEELIGEKNLSGDNLDKLLKALISGAGAKEIASIVSKITGKKVKIPLQYERKTVEEFEKEKSTFGYAFRKNFIPMFRTAAIVAVVLGLILFIGFRFVYKPLHAESLYKKGWEEIYSGNNSQANAYFDRAFGDWQKKDWFYKYAEGFAENKQYILAEEKYEQLLGWYQGDRKGILDYAGLEFKTLGKYPEAEALLKGLLFEDQVDYDARLMLGDTYMEWAREIDPSLYEDARFNYAKLLEQFGGKDSLLFRMLRYFIRTDNYTEAMKLYEAFEQNP